MSGPASDRRLRILIERILADSGRGEGLIHGLAHWEQVAANAASLARGEGVNSPIPGLFAYFHDCRRHNDGADPEHGARAGDYVQTFSAAQLGLSPDDRERLIFACRHHNREIRTEDAAVQICWDADRLDLPRVGIRVDPDRLFTKTARNLAEGR